MSTDIYRSHMTDKQKSNVEKMFNELASIKTLQQLEFSAEEDRKCIRHITDTQMKGWTQLDSFTTDDQLDIQTFVHPTRACKTFLGKYLWKNVSFLINKYFSGHLTNIHFRLHADETVDDVVSATEHLIRYMSSLMIQVEIKIEILSQYVHDVSLKKEIVRFDFKFSLI
jgi:hypothetical protein